jgi:hypothetical protein
MTLRSGARIHRDNGEPSRLGSFLRSLLAGVPWSESAAGTEVRHFATPEAGELRVHNPNGHTMIVGEDRGDICIDIEKTVAAVPAMAEAGITDFRATLAVPNELSAATDFLAPIAQAFRQAAGR